MKQRANKADISWPGFGFRWKGLKTTKESGLSLRQRRYLEFKKGEIAKKKRGTATACNYSTNGSGVPPGEECGLPSVTKSLSEKEIDRGDVLRGKGPT